MKKKTQIFTFIIIISLALVLIAGCKPEEKEGFSPTEDQTANTVPTTPAEPAQPTETKNETPAAPITNATPTTPIAPVTPSAPLYVNDSYYAGLYNECNKGSMAVICCNQSVDKMKAGGYKMPTALDCETGYGANRLSCMGSLRWCEPVNEATLGQLYCDATADCTPKPECHPKDCINKEYSVNYVKPAECPLPYYVDRAYSDSDCECINHKCTNKKA